MTQTPDITLGGVEGQKGLAPAFGTAAFVPSASSRCASRPSGRQSAGDLVDLIELNKRWEIEDACAERKRRRLARSAASRRGWETQRAIIRQRDPLRAAPLPQDDWDPCPACKFILVACDCDAPINLERDHAA